MRGIPYEVFGITLKVADGLKGSMESKVAVVLPCTSPIVNPIEF
jgi:hypothetical protein